jgi:hypothetical protein
MASAPAADSNDDKLASTRPSLRFIPFFIHLLLRLSETAIPAFCELRCSPIFLKLGRFSGIFIVARFLIRHSVNHFSTYFDLSGLLPKLFDLPIRENGTGGLPCQEVVSKRGK